MFYFVYLLLAITTSLKGELIIGAKYTNLFEYLKTLVLIYSAMGLSRDKWLTDRERDFYAVTLLNYLEGETSPISEDAALAYEEYFSPKVTKGQVADYIGKLARKGWLRYASEKHELTDIPPLFKEVDTKKSIVDFKLSYSSGTLDRPDNDGHS